MGLEPEKSYSIREVSGFWGVDTFRWLQDVQTYSFIWLNIAVAGCIFCTVVVLERCCGGHYHGRGKNMQVYIDIQ